MFVYQVNIKTMLEEESKREIASPKLQALHASMRRPGSPSFLQKRLDLVKQQSEGASAPQAPFSALQKYTKNERVE